MRAINTGGPAFPTSFDKNYPNEIVGGMTLRDYFAAKALTGCLPGSRVDPSEYAKLAYRMADAMLAARGEV